MLFDLDPPDEPDGFEQAIEVAHLFHELLDELDLPSYVKTSGSDGIHVVAPITRRSTFEQTYDFAEGVSRVSSVVTRAGDDGVAEEEAPGRIGRPPAERVWGKTIASVYSVRPKPGAPVSTPLRWDELKPAVRPRDFTMTVALERLQGAATCSRRCWTTRARSRRRRRHSRVRRNEPERTSRPVARAARPPIGSRRSVRRCAAGPEALRLAGLRRLLLAQRPDQDDDQEADPRQEQGDADDDAEQRHPLREEGGVERGRQRRRLVTQVFRAPFETGWSARP